MVATLAIEGFDPRRYCTQFRRPNTLATPAVLPPHPPGKGEKGVTGIGNFNLDPNSFPPRLSDSRGPTRQPQRRRHDGAESFRRCVFSLR